MELLPDISKWIQILLRWSHVFFAILWVGTSFTFNYLDNKLPKNLKKEDTEADGILQHSGYYYKLTRYLGAPQEVPKNVIIWKYTSYLTFLSGFALLILIYYVNADILMVDKRLNPNIFSGGPWLHLATVKTPIKNIRGKVIPEKEYICFKINISSSHAQNNLYSYNTHWVSH